MNPSHLLSLLAGLLLSLTSSLVHSQELPQGYFRNPLDCNIGLSATFAEFRTGHFHAGLDMRTGGTIGLPVHAAADGYVCGIRISPWGGGKMLYIKHPNGYTSVYMHLNDFASEIGQWVRNEQYKEQSFAIVRDIPEGVLPVKKGQVVAHSGNTGGSGGPHLHFELRKDGLTINPLRFGLPYSDNLKPVIRGIRIYPTAGQPFDLGKEDNISIAGPFYLGIYATDAAEGSTAKNGVDKVELFVDGILFFQYVTNRFPLDSSRISNALIDYPLYVRTRQAYLLTRALPGALGDWIPVRHGDGILRFTPGSTHSLRIRAHDIKGNIAERTFQVTTLASTASPAAPDAPEKGTYAITYSKPLKFNGEHVKISFPAYTLYDNDRMRISSTPSSLYRSPVCAVEPCTSDLPPHLWYTLSIKASTPTEKAVIVRIDGKRPTAYKTSREGEWYTASVRDFGHFALTVDNEKPRISPINFREGKNLKTNILRIKISDNLSGIETYNCYLNGEWILAEYDGKSASLTIDASGAIKKGVNKLRVAVVDAAGNVADVTFTIRKI